MNAKLGHTLRHPRISRGQVLAAILCAGLGFALVVQVRVHARGENLESARPADLVLILDNVTEESRRLSDELRELEAARQRLTFGSDRSRAALEQTTKLGHTLGILAGTLPAQGPGIELTIDDPGGQLQAHDLLNALQELRDAGAEVVQVNGVRVIASTHFVDDGQGRITVDGTSMSSPYAFTAIGDPATLASALQIPGGVFSNLRDHDAQPQLAQHRMLRIDAVVPGPTVPSPVVTQQSESPQ
ncbi:MAG: DUF881 domain-containing protein [Sporichthyaceae bacterium]|nr:DUF881 domain-containing protein [Sporichthyaceae bacterium]